MPFITASAVAGVLLSEPLLALGTIHGHAEYPRLALGLAAVSSVVIGRGLWRLVADKTGERVLIVGSSPLALRLKHEIDAHPELGWQVFWLPEDPKLAPEIEAERLSVAIRDYAADRIVVGLADRRGRLPVRALLTERVRGARVEPAATTYERVTGKLAIEVLCAGDLVFGEGFRNSWLDRAWTRASSIAIALIALAITAVLFPFLALAIKLNSDGPVLFRHERRGRGGKPFQLIKLRTMSCTPRSSDWERDNLTRITAVGAWLRRFHLDELPQFWNVLRGDMNVVGPRPHPMANAELFKARIPYYELRALVRPGITGWAQVRYGYANDLDEEVEKMRYDLYYLKHRNAWLDLMMIPATIRVTVSGGRALHGQSVLTPLLVEAASASRS